MIMISLSVLEDKFCIKKFFIDVFRGKISTANNEDFSRNESGGFWLCSLNFFEKLFENPHQWLEISWSEDFGNKISTISQKVAGQFKSMKNELTLCVSILAPVGSNIGCTIIKNNITFLIFEHFFQCVITSLGRNIADEWLRSRNFFNRIKIDTNNGWVDWHKLFGNLHPTTWSGTQVDKCGWVIEEIVLSVQLDQFISSSGTISLSLSVMIICIKSLLWLGLLTHWSMLITFYYKNFIISLSAL